MIIYNRVYHTICVITILFCSQFVIVNSGISSEPNQAPKLRKKVYVAHEMKNQLRSNDSRYDDSKIWCKNFPGELNVALTRIGFTTKIQPIEIDMLDDEGMAPTQFLYNLATTSQDTNTYFLTFRLTHEFDCYKIFYNIIHLAHLDESKGRGA